jgi:hypothetical protein
MTFPTGTEINTSNLDSADDDPSLARVDLYNLAVAVNSIIASVNQAQGVAVLDGSGKLAASNLSGYMNLTGDISLRPSTGIVNLRNVLRLNQISVTDIGTALGTDTPSAGDVVFLTDGDAGQPCIACYDGTDFKVIRLMTQVGDVGAALTSGFAVTAEADA